MMNQERLLSATLDRQSEIIRNQERLLSESLESQREIMKRQEKLFANMTEGLTLVLERSLSRGDSPRQAHAFNQNRRSGMLDSQGDSPRLYQHDQQGQGPQNSSDCHGYTTPCKPSTHGLSSLHPGQGTSTNSQSNIPGVAQGTSTPISGSGNVPFRPILDTISNFETGRSLGFSNTRQDLMPRQNCPLLMAAVTGMGSFFLSKEQHNVMDGQTKNV